MDWGKTATLIAIIFLGLWNGYKEYLEWRVRKTIRNVTGLDLGPNPERCADHEKRLRAIEETCGGIKTDIAVIKTRLEIVR